MSGNPFQYSIWHIPFRSRERVLAVDFDSQSNLTTCFGSEEEADVTIGDLMMSVMEEEELPDRSEYIWERNGVDFIPASINQSVSGGSKAEIGNRNGEDAICYPGINQG